MSLHHKCTKWYKINANEILVSHKLVQYGDHTAQIVPFPPANLPETNAFTTVMRLTFLQAQDGQISDNHKQSMYSNITLVNQNTNSSHQSQDVHLHNKSTVILLQSGIIS